MKSKMKYYLAIFLVLVTYTIACTQVTASSDPHRTDWSIPSSDRTFAFNWDQSNDTPPSANLRIFSTAGVASLIHAQKTVVSGQDGNVDLGGGVSAGLMLQVDRNYEGVHFFAKVSGSRIYDTEHLRTLNNYGLSMGLMYKPNYIGIGVGLGSLFRPNINIGNVGSIVIGTFEYPINKLFNFLILAEYAPPIIQRTRMASYVGFSVNL